MRSCPGGGVVLVGTLSWWVVVLVESCLSGELSGCE